MAIADDLVTTRTERAALDALRTATGDRDGPMERHCVRVFRIARLLAPRRADLDVEALLCAAFLHDIGAYPVAAGPGPYVSDGRRFAARLLEPFGWPSERLRRCLEAIELHHQWRSQWTRGAEVELLRRADLVDLSGGVVAFGASRATVRGLMREVPRAGFGIELIGLARRILPHRPGELARILTVRAGRD